jgi:zinc protease
MRLFQFAVVSFASLIVSPIFAAPVEPAPVSALVKSVDIPHEQFILNNGLRVIIHTDRKAPVVAVSVWYHVGSKDEPKGKTGFAHLFEHLMFNGSENAKGDFFEPLQQVGATDMNGTTWFDRTNYFETVPTGALDRVLFLESDRMGHLLGGLDQAKLDNQRAVVQNEKRQGDNDPFGLVDYVVYDTLFPGTHPYRHSAIGSMADLNGASLDDVKNWFRAKYGPDNAVLVLAGDIDVAAAKPMVQKWFGDIPRGPVVTRVAAPVPTLAAPVSKVMRDQVPYTRITRHWAVEGVNGADNIPLQAAATVLGGLASSRLDNALVRGDKMAVSVTASVQSFEQVGVLTVSADVAPGKNPSLVAKRLDALIAEFLRTGPTADEVRRVATRSISSTIGGFESVGGFSGKAVALAEGLVYSGDAGRYKAELAELASLTPTRIAQAARKWMGRPVFALRIDPGERENSPAMRAITGDVTPPTGRGPAFYRDPKLPLASKPLAAVDRSKFPDVGTLASLDFPKIERATLSNGIKIFFARRSSVPVVRVAVSFDAGYASDPANGRGTHSLALMLMDEGTTTRSSVQIAEEQERLGASISTGASLDRTSVKLYALAPNLAPSLDLLADVIRNPAFAPAEVERLRTAQLASIAEELSDPSGVARYLMPEKLFGKTHPYGAPGAGSGSVAVVKSLTRQAVINYYKAWMRPSKAQIFVVGDTSLAALIPLLESSLGNWIEPATVAPRKNFSAAIPKPIQKVYLVDRPDAPQSVIRAGLVLNQNGRDDLQALSMANEVLGGSFLSRLNTDLRETKGWSYGVGSRVQDNEERVAFVISAPVQSDKTGPALSAIIADTKAFLGTNGTTAAELELTVNGAVRSLPGDFETSDSVLAALQRIVWLNRPDDYYTQLPQKYRALTAGQLDATARGAIDPAKFIYVVVGDAKTVRPQLDAVGLPVEILTPPAAK